MAVSRIMDVISKILLTKTNLLLFVQNSWFFFSLQSKNPVGQIKLKITGNYP